MLYQKLEELETLLPQVNRHLSEDTTRQTIAEAEKLLALKREIILANPLLDVDKILIARYRLGNKARKAMGPSLGTSVANYNSLFSSRGKDMMQKSASFQIFAETFKVKRSISRKRMYPSQIYNCTGMQTDCCFPPLMRTASGKSMK